MTRRSTVGEGLRIRKNPVRTPGRRVQQRTGKQFNQRGEEKVHGQMQSEKLKKARTRRRFSQVLDGDE